MKTLKTLRTELLARPDTRAEYDALADEFAMARELIAARTRAGLTQAEVAARMGTTQSAVARLEGGKAAPSLRSVQRYAQAVGYRAVVRLVQGKRCASARGDRAASRAAPRHSTKAE